MVKLQWLQVNKFRSVKPGTRLTFNAGHNVLLGQNGTGKTTLLNLIAAAVKSDFTAFKDEEFELSYSLASAHASMTVAVRNEHQPRAIPSGMTGIPTLRPGAFAAMNALNAPVVSFEADSVGKGTGTAFKLEGNGKNGSIQRVGDTGPGLIYSDFGPNLGMSMVMGLSGYLSQQGVPETFPEAGEHWFSETFTLFVDLGTCRFDETLEYFEGLGAGPIEIRQAVGGQMSAFPYTDSDDSISKKVMLRAAQEWGADRYVLTDAELPFLKRASQLLGFESAEAILELQNSTRDGHARVMELGDLKFYFRQRGGRRVSGRMLSYGQKRMLAFLHYAASAAAVIIADELVNGLHHHWIRACFEMMEKKQLFLTSQNPLLLDYLGFQSVEDVRSTFVLCRWDKESEQMLWENMSQEAAQDFFDSYKVGFQQVGELLQTKGLW